MRLTICLLATILLSVSCFSAIAEGDPTRRAIRLDTLLLDAAKGFSIKEFNVETGIYYRWRIESDGREEYKLVAPSLFHNSWIYQVVIEDLEVKPYGLHAVEFDDDGKIDIWFIPQRPGRYRFFVVGLETQGFSGEFIVK